MLGDYLGIAESTDPDVPAVPVWVDTRTGNPDPFITRVGIAPDVDFTSFQASRLSLAQINDPQLGGPTGDADGDGEDNLSEFLSGTEPNDPASVVHTSRQLNISTREMVGTGEECPDRRSDRERLNGKAGDPARDRSFSRRGRPYRRVAGSHARTS